MITRKTLRIHHKLLSAYFRETEQKVLQMAIQWKKWKLRSNPNTPKNWSETEDQLCDAVSRYQDLSKKRKQPKRGGIYENH